MAKYNPKKIKQCEEWVAENGLMEYGGALMKDFCKHMDIDYKTYKTWLEREEFKEAIERGKATFKSKLTYELSVSLSQAAKGGEYTKIKKHKEVYLVKDSSTPQKAANRDEHLFKSCTDDWVIESVKAEKLDDILSADDE